MKRLLSIVLAVVLSLSLCACSKQKRQNEKLTIVTTVFAVYDFAREIGVDCIDAKLLLKPGAEAHSYEPTPQDIVSISESDVFIYVGGENDEWVEEILESIDTDGITCLKLMDCIDKKYAEEEVEGMEVHEHHEEEENPDEEHEEEHEEWDEHVWTSPVNAIEISSRMMDVFSRLDSKNAAVYKDNFNEYSEKLSHLDTQIREVISGSKRKEIIFGDRFPLRYFVEEYGLSYYAAFPGCASNNEASAATIAFLVDKVREDEIPVVFKIELTNENMAKTIAEENNAKILTFYSMHNISKDDYDNGESYYSLMNKNLESLKEALN